MPIDLWFDGFSGSYWLRSGQRYVRLDKSDAKAHLLFTGAKLPQGINGLSQFESLFVATQRERSVSYAGPLAGYPVGPVTNSDGSTVLVTNAAGRWPKASPEPGWIGDVFAQLVGENPEALKRLLLWMRHAIVALRDGSFAPGQMLVLAGPAGCGKTFAQIAIAEMLGGRFAKAFDWMMGRTGHNGELAGAETWMIDDDDSQTDAKSRRSFGNAVKRCTVSGALRIRKMHTEAVTLTTFRRIVLSVNDEAENLSILPILDDSIADKLMLFRCSHADKIGADRLENMRKLRESLPGFVAYLLKLRVPSDLADPRFGVKAWHDTGLLESLGELSPESRLVNLIDQVIFAEGADAVQWEGSAELLEKALRQSSFAWAVEKLLSFSSACGVYLARLAARMPERFACSMVRGKKRWKLKPPRAD
jgi:hypothetical protein